MTYVYAPDGTTITNAPGKNRSRFAELPGRHWEQTQADPPQGIFHDLTPANAASHGYHEVTISGTDGGDGWTLSDIEPDGAGGFHRVWRFDQALADQQAADRAAAALVPDLSDDDVRKTVAVSAENDFRTDAWLALHRQRWDSLLDALATGVLPTAQEIAALRIGGADRDAVLDQAAAAVVAMDDPATREAFTNARIAGAKTRGRP